MAVSGFVVLCFMAETNHFLEPCYISLAELSCFPIPVECMNTRPTLVVVFFITSIQW